MHYPSASLGKPEPASLNVVIGTTAVGKTAWVLDYAEAIGAEIVNCDAVCVYRGMNIGSAKPNSTEQARVKHHLLDLVAVAENYSIGDYVQAAYQVCQQLWAEGKRVVVAGGSGFYLKSYYAAVNDTVAVPKVIRDEVADIEAKSGHEGMLQALKQCNPGGLEFLIDLRNPRRVARALERCLASGLPLATLRADFLTRSSPFASIPKQLVLLQRERHNLEQRIDFRVRKMLADGLVDEVRMLEKQGLRENRAAAAAIGYRETLAVIDGHLSFGQLADTIAANTRKLAAKQRKWFRTQLPKPECVIDLTSLP
jgi:tRNA dimethylallyltransferase